MLVMGSDGKSYWATQKECKLQVNGSFIQIYFTKDGVKDSISILTSDLKKIIDGKHGDSIEGNISLRESFDMNTLVSEMVDKINIMRLQK